MKKVNAGDNITAEWANSLHDSLRSAVGEGMLDADGIYPCPYVEADSSWRMFELKDDMAPSRPVPVPSEQRANAYHITTAMTSPFYYHGDDDPTFVVTDKFGMSRGRKYEKFLYPYHRGSFGWAKYIEDEDIWQIARMQSHAMLLRGVLVDPNDISLIRADSVKVMQPSGSIITNSDPNNDMPISDPCDMSPYGWNGDPSVTVIVAWNEQSAGYELVYICPQAFEVVTNVRVNTPDRTIEKKYQFFYMIPQSDESSWRVIHTGTDC